MTTQCSNLEVILGTYEEYILGYEIKENAGTFKLVQSFSDKSHVGPIKCISSGGKYTASGGVDDRIYVYDIKNRKQSQILQHHSGTITGLSFSPDGSHIFSTSEDGRIVAVRIGSWMMDAKWEKAHNGNPVTHISLHPSGKLALSLGTDMTLRTWNLVKGRVAFKTNLKNMKNLRSPDCLEWSQNGSYFSICGARALEIWDVNTAEVTKTEHFKVKPICLTWISDSQLLIGLEDGTISLVSTIQNEKGKSWKAHDARVKSIACKLNMLVSCSSSGEITLWNIEGDEMHKLDSLNIGCRPTCVTIANTTKESTEPVENQEKPNLSEARLKRKRKHDNGK